MIQPKFTIITPCFNSEETIVQTIESVINQTYLDWELILIDDGSSDDTGTIIKHYVNNDDRVKYIKKENGGPSSARNLGIIEASGLWLSFLDADDTYTSNRLEVLSENISLFDGVYLFAHDYNYLQSGDVKPSNIIVKSGLNDSIFSIRSVIGQFPLCTGNFCFSRDLLGEVDFFNEAFRHGEDLDAWIRHFDGIKFFYISDKLFNYQHINDNSLTADKDFHMSCITSNAINGKYRFDLYTKNKLRFISSHIWSNLCNENVGREEISSVRTGLTKNYFFYGRSEFVLNFVLYIGTKQSNVFYFFSRLRYFIKRLMLECMRNV